MRWCSSMEIIPSIAEPTIPPSLASFSFRAASACLRSVISRTTLRTLSPCVLTMRASNQRSSLLNGSMYSTDCGSSVSCARRKEDRKASDNSAGNTSRMFLPRNSEGGTSKSSGSFAW